jgi:hypothetical protein
MYPPLNLIRLGNEWIATNGDLAADGSIHFPDEDSAGGYPAAPTRRSMAKPPRAVGPLLCRDVAIVPGAATMSLVGLFNARSYSQWPSPLDPFFFYALLVGGEGDGLLEFVVLSATTEQMIYRYRRWYTIPGPDLPVHLLRIKRCVFPLPGRYLVSLRFDGEILTQRPLDVQHNSPA